MLPLNINSWRASCCLTVIILEALGRCTIVTKLNDNSKMNIKLYAMLAVVLVIAMLFIYVYTVGSLEQTWLTFSQQCTRVCGPHNPTAMTHLLNKTQG